jgi:replicative DNA helicase
MTGLLRLVPDLDEPEAVEGWPTHAEDHEQQLIGALMHLSADDTHNVFDPVPDSAICDPIGRWAYELIPHIVREGQDVDPIAVLGAGRRSPTTESRRSRNAPTPCQHHQLARYLVDACTDTPNPPDLASCVHTVLEDAFRRAFDTRASRMQELPASGASRDRLAQQFAAIRTELDDVFGPTDTAERSRP